MIPACIRTRVFYFSYGFIKAAFGLCGAWLVPLFDYNLFSEWWRLLTNSTAHKWVRVVIKALILRCEVNFVWNMIDRSFSIAYIFETFDDVQLTITDSGMVSGSCRVRIVICTKTKVGAWINWAGARTKWFVASFMATKQWATCICLLTQFYLFDTLRHRHSLLTNGHVFGVILLIWQNSKVYVDF